MNELQDQGLPHHSPAAEDSWQKRLLEYYRDSGTDYAVINGVPWIVYQRMVVPVGPVSWDFSISAEQEQFLLTHFKKAVLVRYTDGFHSDVEDGPWYAVTCRKFRDLDQYNSKLRYYIRRGLNRCVVRQVDAEYTANRGYEVYASAFVRYKNKKGPDVPKATWERNTLRDRNFPDLRHYWGVFVDNQLVGYMRTLNFGKTEVNYESSKFDPKHLSDYSSYALNFIATKYYLVEQSVEYVNDGFRNIMHETHVQDFLVRVFGFQRTPTNLYVRYRSWLAAALSLPRFVKKWLGRVSPSYAALCRLDEARCR